jgi:hypothetical protein
MIVCVDKSIFWLEKTKFRQKIGPGKKLVQVENQIIQSI